MRKVIVLIITIALLASMALPAYACTPKLNIPKISIPEIKPTFKIQLSEDFWDNYFAKNPLNIDLSGVVVGGK